MLNSSHQNPKDAYFSNPNLNVEQIFNAIMACLDKAQALVNIGTTIDFEAHPSHIVNNYLWALSDIIQNAKNLCHL